MARRRKWWMGVVLTVAVVAGLVWVTRPAAVPVDVAIADRGPVALTIEEEGLTQVERRFTVAAPVGGRLERPLVEQGDSVSQDTPISFISATPLDPRTRSEAQAHYQSALDVARTARANLARAREALAQAERDEARTKALERQGVVATQARERATLEVASRRREVEASDYRAQAAAHDVDQARVALTGVDAGRIPLRAPTAGRVLRVLEPSERVVPAGTPIVEIGDPSALEVAVDLLSGDAVRVAPGDTLRLTGWGGPATLLAVVRRVAPSGFTRVSALGVEEQRVPVVGKILSPPEQLGDRYRIDVTVAVERVDSAVRIPRSALFREGGSWRVFVLDGSRARIRTVTIGLTGTDLVQIVDGVEPGAVVIRHPDERIEDGVRVEPRESSADGADPPRKVS